jgi:hypothetical protein
MDTRKAEARGSLLEPKPLLSTDQATETAIEAYIYGYPLVLMDVTRQVMTAVSQAGEPKAPVNQFLHLRRFPDPAFTDVVSPNADTLYSTAWLDLGREPMVLSVPEVEKRYYLMPMLDAWTNVFSSPGTRTTGVGRGDFAILGPGWRGKLPAGVRGIESPTHMVWLIGRTQTNGKEDYAAVHAIQDQYRLTPLSAWGRPYAPPTRVPVLADVDVKTPPAQQVARMNAATFFARLNALMKDNPPAAADAGALERFAAVGVVPGKPVHLASLEPVVAEALEQSVLRALTKIIAEARKPHGRTINGWHVSISGGAYGRDYLLRAAVALLGLGASLPEDAIYPHATTDSQGAPLTGAHRYVIRFPAGQLPPVNAFWSLTLYNDKQAFVENPLGRYAIGDRDPLAFNDDRSLTLYIQHESPGKDKEPNWLPAPPDSFNVVMRLYWPGKSIVDGTWKIPPLERAE